MSIEERIKKGESFLLANNGQFLGKLSLNQFDRESISNIYGIYGSQYSATSIHNQYSVYGSVYSALSPNNPYTSTPPKIYLRGRLWGVLTVNSFLLTNATSPMGLNDWMRINGLFY